MKTTASIFFSLATVFAVPALFGEHGISAATLEEKISSGASIALIDLRSERSFREGHLPGAMNMPKRSLNPRRLPSRTLVFYGDGLGQTDPRAAVQSVREATGRDDLHYLRGGLAAWESASRTTTRGSGVASSPTPAITYHDMVKTGGAEMMVLDVRTPVEPNSPGTFGLAGEDSGERESAAQPTDLQALLPEARIERPQSKDSTEPGAFGLAGESSAVALQTDPDSELIVVIDDGDGSGADLVRSLRASGNRRVVLLAGGETILRHGGEPGLGRQSSGVRVIGPEEEREDQ